MDAGLRDSLVSFYPRNASESALGTEEESDGAAVQAWASVRFGSGQERREAGQAGSVQSATFRVLANNALRAADERWEIEFKGSRWGITSIADLGQIGEIEFTATRNGA